MILDSYKIPYELIDITAPGSEQERDFMREHGKKKNERVAPQPPQIFIDDDLLGVSYHC